MGSLILAVRFLTIVPVPGREATGEGAFGRAAWWFPVVGLLLGAGLALLDRGLSLVLPPLLASVLVVSAWKIATGGIHLDGLADCLDGLAGASREQRLAIMGDSHIGVFGATGLVMAFVGALAALTELPPGLHARVLLLAPVVGRLCPTLVGPWFPPATPGRGSGAAFLRAVPRAAGPAQLVLAIAFAVWLLGPWGALAVTGPAAVAAGWAWLVAARLGGLTGDALGSTVELAELAALLIAVALAYRATI
jgi:adenosylcobinamide-GDP ribazoletransferase